MKVVQVVHAFLPRSLGGAEIYAHDLGQELVRQGGDVLVLRPGGPADRDVTEERVGPLRVATLHAGARDPRGARDLWSRHAGIDGVVDEMLAREAPDLLHVHHLSGLSAGIPALARARGIPVVFTLHDYWYMCPRGQLLKRDLTAGDPLDAAGCARCLDEELRAEEGARPELLDALAGRLAAAETIVGPGAAPPGLVRVELGAVSRDAVFAHPPLSIAFRVDVAGDAVLAFHIGMMPPAHAVSEGVRFEVWGDGARLWSASLHPRKEPAHRLWIDHEVPLPPGTRRLELRTEPVDPANAGNAALWADPRVVPAGAARVAARAEAYRREIAQAAQVRCPSRYLLGRYAAWGVPPERMVHVDYGFDPSRFAGFAREPGEGVRVGFLGSLIPSKGAHVLVEAFARAAIPGATLQLWGREVPYFGSADYGRGLRDLARGLPVTFHGPLPPDRIAEAFRRMDVLVVPSLWPENSPLTIHEAFLTGTPVVASAAGGVPELVEPERNGLLVAPGEAGELAAALKRMSDEGTRAAMTPRTPVRHIGEDAREILAVARWSR